MAGCIHDVHTRPLVRDTRHLRGIGMGNGNRDRRGKEEGRKEGGKGGRMYKRLLVMVWHTRHLSRFTHCHTKHAGTSRPVECHCRLFRDTQGDVTRHTHTHTQTHIQTYTHTQRLGLGMATVSLPSPLTRHATRETHRQALRSSRVPIHTAHCTTAPRHHHCTANVLP